MYRVGLQSCIDMLRTGLCVLVFLFNDVGAQQWTANLANPLVVNLVTRLDVVITYGFGIVFHVVDNRSCDVLVFRHHIVRPIYARLTLQDVAIIYQQEMILAILFTLLFDIGVCTRKCTLDGGLLHKVVGEKMSMHIAGFNHLNFYGLIVFCLDGRH